MDFLGKIKIFLKEKYIEFMGFKKRKRPQSSYYKNSTTKHSMNNSCTMELSSETKAKKEEINNQVKEIVKLYFNTPEKLIQYIRTQGYSVYRINKAEKLLSILGEDEGFLTPLKGFKALFLTLLIAFTSSEKININFKTNELFIFDVNNTEIYTIARALYKCTAFNYNLPGYDYKSQEIYKKLYRKRNQTSPFTGCSINDLYACKETIAREMESVNFTINLSVEFETSKKAAKKLQQESINV